MDPSLPLFVVNPASGGGRTGKTFGSMRATIERTLGPIAVEQTGARGHGIDVARAGAERGHPLVVAVGGDGTFHEVCNGVLEAKVDKRPEVGLVAQGTGGDFRRTVGLEHRLEIYLAALASKKTRPLDVGRLTYRDHTGQQAHRYFVNILSAGMGGLVDRYVAEAPAAIGGKAAYFSASVRALLRIKEGRLVCKSELAGVTDERRLATFMLAICNGRYFGGGMHVAPMAQPDDGAFEVVSLGARSKLAFAVQSSSIYEGKHLDKPGTQHFRCDRLELDLVDDAARDVFLLDVDGEPLGGLPITVELIRHALTLRCP
ncbi:MAG: YegS/Rv2252/BmrU family lipid kinase [Myxococcales bacterium]|nr:YegS/Rv2252/BmrU family lipid kinase [Myxococcales bacterium]